jgi:DNA helicase TIP49 (TBP-interacting protein)
MVVVMKNIPKKASVPADAHSHVALLLCESLLHVLVEEGVLAKEKALSAAETVVELTQQMAEDGDDPAVNGLAAELAEAIANSLAVKAEP